MNNTEEVINLKPCCMCRGTGLVNRKKILNKDKPGYKECNRCRKGVPEGEFIKKNGDGLYKTCNGCRVNILNKYYLKKKSKVN